MHLQFGGDDLLHGKDDAVLAPEGNGGATVLDSLAGVVHLKDASVGRELRGVEVVTGANGRHDENGNEAEAEDDVQDLKAKDVSKEEQINWTLMSLRLLPALR